MSSTSRGRVNQGEMQLPLESEPDPPTASSPLPSPPAEITSLPASPPAGRRGRKLPAQAPSPQAWADEVIRQLLLRQGEVTETWGATVDVLTRRIQGEVAGLSEAGARTTGEVTGTMEAIERTASSLGQLLREVPRTFESQAETLRNTVSEQLKAFAAITRDAASHIQVARHELALASAELRRRTFRHGLLFGAGTAIVILIAARLLFPFWGMRRSDVEAWSRGTRLARTFEEAAPEKRRSILRALGWEEMPDAPASRPSASSGPPAGGR